MSDAVLHVAVEPIGAAAVRTESLSAVVLPTEHCAECPAAKRVGSVVIESQACVCTFPGKFVIETSANPAVAERSKASLFDGNMYARWICPAAVLSALSMSTSARHAVLVHCPVIVP